MLVDHLDRNPEKQLVSGRVGHIVAWMEHEDEESNKEDGLRTLSHCPKVILVDFHTDKWQMTNTPGPGMYPIFPTERRWWIDGYRGRHAVLRVKRLQFPLAPAFATTAHQAQGRTEKAVIADLQLGRGVSSIASYVAITRVKQRKGLLIYRDFELELFQKGYVRTQIADERNHFEVPSPCDRDLLFNSLYRFVYHGSWTLSTTFRFEC